MLSYMKQLAPILTSFHIDLGEYIYIYIYIHIYTYIYIYIYIYIYVQTSVQLSMYAYILRMPDSATRTPKSHKCLRGLPLRCAIVFATSTFERHPSSLSAKLGATGSRHHNYGNCRCLNREIAIGIRVGSRFRGFGKK